MNINLGAPYEAAIKSIIEKGYAGSQTEVIRQAILAYERMIEEEELALVHKAVEIEMEEILRPMGSLFLFSLNSDLRSSRHLRALRKSD
jgi:Arc/MetJ-type ribon-helix-helix transcriptional regulator